eukprot:gene3238-6407_t
MVKNILQVERNFCLTDSKPPLSPILPSKAEWPSGLRRQFKALVFGQHNGPPPSPISKGSFFAISLGIFCSGALYGLRHQINEEKFVIQTQINRGPFLIASKALLYGTLLCFSGFGLGITMVAFATGTSSLEDFGVLMKKSLSTKESLEKHKRVIQDENAKVKGMNPTDESAYWTQYLVGDDPKEHETPKRIIK